MLKQTKSKNKLNYHSSRNGLQRYEVILKPARKFNKYYIFNVKKKMAGPVFGSAILYILSIFDINR